MSSVETKFCEARDGYGDECGRPVVQGTQRCKPCLTMNLPRWQQRATQLRAELEALEATIQSAEEALEAAGWTESMVLVGHVVLGR